MHEETVNKRNIANLGKIAGNVRKTIKKKNLNLKSISTYCFKEEVSNTPYNLET